MKKELFQLVQFLQRTGNRDAPNLEGLCYPEWDYKEGKYVQDAVSVYLESPRTTPNNFYEQTLQNYHRQIRRIRNEFEQLNHEEKRKEKRLPDGKEIDLTAAIDYMVAIRNGNQPEENVFQDEITKRRDIAVGILTDFSSSTKKNNRITRIKESLVLATEAFEAIGDNYAIFGYSSPSWDPRELELQPIADFDQPLTQEGRYAIGYLSDRRLTPTGAAMRFMADRIEQTKERTKILMLITDGEPQHATWDPHDSPTYEYNREYAFQDTRKAVIETKRKGIHPFCVSIETNPETNGRLTELYGKNHVHLEDVSLLPQKLINFYKRIAF